MTPAGLLRLWPLSPTIYRWAWVAELLHFEKISALRYNVMASALPTRVPQAHVLKKGMFPRKEVMPLTRTQENALPILSFGLRQNPIF
ncbi:MAG: hypothetical protein D6755_03580 [Anaerolineae bacterium]|nr:MAG: hypothetical protein D6755_03580 [Anaerolineae bacterium]